jgi:rubrerythrin
LAEEENVMGEEPTEREWLEGLRYEDKFPDADDERQTETGSVLCCPDCGVNCVVDPPGVRCPECGKRPADILNPEGKGIGERR